MKVAEASKAIENAQRDVNISFVNELALIFDRVGIDTQDVLDAAGTKWNFLKYKPGLVGGHCISVDPYYLAQKAQEAGYHPEIILSGRRLNDDMGKYVAGEVVKLMMKRSLPVLGSNVLMLGITFKENCPDLRNTRVVDVIDAIRRYGMEPLVVDRWVDPAEAEREYGLSVLGEIPTGRSWNSVVAAVAHREFASQTAEQWSRLLEPKGVIVDLKSIVPRELGAMRL